MDQMSQNRASLGTLEHGQQQILECISKPITLIGIDGWEGASVLNRQFTCSAIYLQAICFQTFMRPVHKTELPIQCSHESITKQIKRLLGLYVCSRASANTNNNSDFSSSHTKQASKEKKNVLSEAAPRLAERRCTLLIFKFQSTIELPKRGSRAHDCHRRPP